MRPNHTIRSNLAVVDGRQSGLMGCSYSEKCSRAPQCLRADPVHESRALPLLCRVDADCLIFIPNHKVPA
jgi:hypothetical protein